MLISRLYDKIHSKYRGVVGISDAIKSTSMGFGLWLNLYSAVYDKTCVPFKGTQVFLF